MQENQIRQMLPGTSAALSTTPSMIVDNGRRRFEAIVQNADASIVVRVGSLATVTAGGGTALAAGEIYRHRGRGRLYAVAASGTPSVRIVQVIGGSNLHRNEKESTVALATTRKEVLIQNDARLSATIENDDASILITIGDKSVTAGTGGIVLAAGQQFTVYGPFPVYAIAASGTPSISIHETLR